MRTLCLISACFWLLPHIAFADDFTQRVRGILSNRCFACHGPDAEERQGGFQLDVRESFLQEADSGEIPVVVGDPDGSELLRRITTPEDWEVMPPPSFGARLSEEETGLIRKWIEQGAELPEHWAFVAPVKPSLPAVDQELGADGLHTSARRPEWSSHPVDCFVRAKQLEMGLKPSPRATKRELLRRVSLDLTGLPPTLAELARFEDNSSPDAYIAEVDRLLASPAYGEHWARKWLDLARYADSAGYADDPPRTIWAYRDWVIRALNANMPVDQFTIKQLAGDLLPEPTEDDLIATAFHRNTLTNNEGGTNDEEFRNVAVVDRVNTTMAVWMGVTMACAQCHTHKYDPFTHEEYFQLFAIFNQSQDADRRNESPVLPLFTSDQRLQQNRWQARSAELERSIEMQSDDTARELNDWLQQIHHLEWQALVGSTFDSQRGLKARLSETGNVLLAEIEPEAVPVSDVFRIDIAVDSSTDPMAALRLKTLPQEDFPGSGAGFGGGNFVLTSVAAQFQPAEPLHPMGRYVRVELPGKSRILSLAEVEVWANGSNVALQGTAKQSSTGFGGAAKLAIDGKTSGLFEQDKSTTHTNASENPWWELELSETLPIDKVVVWNRTDGDLHERLNGAVVQVLDGNREVVYSSAIKEASRTATEMSVEEVRRIPFRHAVADFSQDGFPASAAIDGASKTGWAIAGRFSEPHTLTLSPEKPFAFDVPGTLSIELRFESPHDKHLLGSFALEVTDNAVAGEWAKLPPQMQQVAKLDAAARSEQQAQSLLRFFARNVAQTTLPLRKELKQLEEKLASIKPATSVPIMRQIEDKEKHRETFVQIRGNYKSHGPRVEPGTPQVFHPLNLGAPEAEKVTPDRLDLARWLVDRRNPLTARVWMNRLWESLFGIGIVRSSEEFGAQGDRPSHPELLDWLAVEFMGSGWDQKQMLRLLVTSQTYQQTSEVKVDDLAVDQDNIWLARGPRVRLSAEMVRDQALAASGLLSTKMNGPPVRPPQPDLGLKAAFGGATDWQTSAGEDRFRRGLYTTWRRSSPYPSMATFDAPSREVCTLRRDSTNTPLQALVTLNDPGFFEAAQGLARRVVLYSPALQNDQQRLARAFELATSRQPTPQELAPLAALLHELRHELSNEPEAANELATNPIGSPPEGADVRELAAFSTVCNVLLNLDEVLMKR